MIDKDGWFHTGDIGRFVDGYLQITDRLKHMLVNAGGKNIYPGPDRRYAERAPYGLTRWLWWGEHQNFMAALIVPDLEVAKSYCRQNSIKYTSDEDLINVKQIIDAVDKDVKQF